MSQRVVAIVQARASSQRLPQKVLRDLEGEPMLVRVVARMKQAKRVDEVVVATSTEPDDDAVATLAAERGFRCFRGSLNDVLDRFRVAAEGSNADVIVRITADCPLIDPAVVDRVVEAFFASSVDYASNVSPTRTFPRGLDTEVFGRAALETSVARAIDVAEREHVTQFILRRPDEFRTTNVTNAVDVSAHRWTVDTAEDIELVRKIYAALPTPFGGLADVLALLEAHPEWAEINRHVEQKKV